MKIYLDAVKKIMGEGNDRQGRYGPTRAMFAVPLHFKMKDGFPAMTTKKLIFRSVAAELLWFISGSGDNRELNRLGCHIWDANGGADYWKPKAKYEGDLGRIYGVQWRHWKRPDGKEIDQLKEIIERIKTNPYDRRLIVSAWNPGEFDQMALPPCHMIFQFFVSDGKLSMHMYQRSADMFLGVPFNIASYALLLHIVARLTNLEPDELVMTLGDAHVVHNHFDAVKEQLSREPFPLCKLWLSPDIKSLEDLNTAQFKEPDDIFNIIKLENYQSHPAIKAPMGV
ncbi:thymidylate synthase [Candidatus Nomurabacteria bacterium RIFCSPLOWO2_01_FULL_39_17]|uniref:Thymidylate synthase n=1 Tax=Candidatus Nomurabacteria bacterium RIFCSPLOWO2_01_FULL_39_17 TaxID=1801770 RepID=A0A1F6WWA9_9BACT|nr:MAG: thymidylate synthase [Candidatus Nomurabacteria bacterium RIFCSPLOWO2_01_FULL_39_17]